MDKHFFLERLIIKRPSVFTQYNYEFLPDKFLTTDYITIECYRHGLFKQKAYGHLAGAGCYKCGAAKRGLSYRLTTNEYIAKAKEKHGDKFSYEKTNYTKKGENLVITCPFHGDFTIRPEAHMWSKHGCPKCDIEIPRTIRKKKLLEKARELHGDKYDYSKVDYAGFNDKVEIVCRKHGSFWVKFWLHAKYGDGCVKCARDNDRSNLSEFISKAKHKHGDRYDYSLVNYVNSKNPITIICKKHGPFAQRADSHLYGNGCIICSKEAKKLSSEEFIRKAREVHGDKYDYSKVKYNGNKRPVEIICKKHGSFWKKPNAHISSSSGCSYCWESTGEKLTALCLDKYGIKYIRQYKISPHRYRYDFFLPDFNIFIEYNGGQHYAPVEIFGGEKAFKKLQSNDNVKKELVKQNNGRLVIITYKFANLESIENELIRLLKFVYPYWLNVSGKIRVFKTIFDVLKFFDITENILIKDYISVIQQRHPNVKVLF